MIVTTAEKRYDELDTIADILRRSKTQNEFVDSMQRLVNGEDTGVTAFRNPALSSEELFGSAGPEGAEKTRALLRTSITLALQSRRNLRSFVLYPGNVETESVPGQILGNYNNLTRTDLAMQIADAMIANPYAVGFSLEVRSAEGRPVGYDFRLLLLRDRSVSREEVVALGHQEFNEKWAAYLSNLKERDPKGYVLSAFKTLNKEQDKIRDDCFWGPKYVGYYFQN